MKQVSLIITDLDDTIWDWLGMWYNSFQPYLTNIQKLTGIELAELKLDFKQLHQKYDTSEISFAYKELKSLSMEHKELIAKENDKPSVIHQYYRDKKEHLQLYDGVLETLVALKAKQVRIVAFTESNSFFVKYRIKTLGIDGIFDTIYTPKDPGIPTSVKRYYYDNYWEPRITGFCELPEETRKPDPDILLRIIKDMGRKVETTIYIGDKLDRDIYMANQACVTSVYAKYGHIIDNAQYELLKEVTHWSEKDVQREITFKQNMQHVTVKPDLEINYFKEILDNFDFSKNEAIMNDVDKTNIVEIWKNIVGVQKHFNDIEIRLRSLALTLLTFLIGAIGFSITEDANVMFFNLVIPLGTIIGIAGIIPMLGFYIMDQHWYHRFLIASVKKGIDIEKSIIHIYPHINLTEQIKEKSPSKIMYINFHTIGKMRIFYGLLIFPLLISAVLLFFGASSNVFLQQYNNVRNNSVRIDTRSDLNKAPVKAGIVMTFDKYGTLLTVNETNNIKNYLDSLYREYEDKNKYFAYAAIMESRKELEEYIIKHGIELK